MGVIAVDVAEVKAGARAVRRQRAPYSEWLRELHNLPDSLLHSTRRRAARALLLGSRPRSILFVCHGNICRSPFAAAAFLHACPPDVRPLIRVRSAGFIGPDRPAPRSAVTSGHKYGIDMSSHRSELLTVDSLRAAELIVVMSADQARGVEVGLRSNRRPVLVLGDLDPLPIQARTIADPWGGAEAAFDASYDRIHRCVGELAKLIARAG